MVSAFTCQLNVSGNEFNSSCRFKLFWAVGSRLKEEEQKKKREKEEMLKLLSCVGQVLRHSSPTTFSVVMVFF